MSRFHVGQRVRIIKSVHLSIGSTATIAREHDYPGDWWIKSDERDCPQIHDGCWLSWESEMEPIEDPPPNWLEIATGRVKDSAVSQELGWKGKVSA